MNTTKIYSETYIKQATKVLDVKKLRVVYNSDWLSKLSFSKLINLCGNLH